jgi:Putative zinc-finger
MVTEHANGENLNCEKVWQEISNYVDGDVDTSTRAAMDKHFATCKRCASVLAGTQNVVKLYGDERMLEVPAGFSRRLEKRLKRTAEKTSRWLTWEAWLVPVAAMILFAVGLKVSDLFLFHPPAKSILAAPEHGIPPDMLVVISDGSKVFHRAGCPFIHDKATERTITAKQAMQQGYVPCSRCLRQYLKAGLEKNPETVTDDDDDGEQHETLSVASVTR